MKSRNVLEILNWATALFKSTQIENPKLNAEQIISHVLDVKRLELYLHSSDIIYEDEIKEIQSL
ncbi:MAG: peptide chain release factor N(5)-glutamine methyltransferase, partial [Candidatus Cloacimonetes bacterium]|nr:peptide chain release factor N(5)-glutamine methyltransferase [Candidatus Cloacimonadota bacterium]